MIEILEVSTSNDVFCESFKGINRYLFRFFVHDL